MRIYPTFFNIFFKGMDPEKAHHVGFWGVQTLRNVGITRALRKYFQPAPELATTVMGITFPSPFGLAAELRQGRQGHCRAGWYRLRPRRDRHHHRPGAARQPAAAPLPPRGR